MEGGCNDADELAAESLLVRPEHFLSVDCGLISSAVIMFPDRSSYPRDVVAHVHAPAAPAIRSWIDE